ncbi:MULTISPECIES: DNA cytosine methyltransferase [unclassified Actinomyces]|uniref:DNA cytosine methyltransferase n=1 Tax=unclassified Actinomyces TaxID=2609248 RepID=UPI00201768D3|nr:MULTISPECIES: DNA cytosine methyltransferase [unclassified Actinomyces]
MTGTRTTKAAMSASAPEASFTYSDLFAGIGGFHAALSGMGGGCVYAVEIDRDAARVYQQNWGLDPLGDITVHAGEDGVDTRKIPEHDILAAGFPCQPFSKSGAQKGMEETRGTLYFNILQVVREHHPTVLLLENVRNLTGPRHKHEWDVIISTLRDEGYHVSDTPAILSPHQIAADHGGRPQVRERVFITATHDPDHIGAPDPQPVTRPRELYGSPSPDWNIEDILDDESSETERYALTPAETRWIDAWDDWVQMFRRHNEPGTKLPGFPIWVDAWADIEAFEADVEAGEHEDTPSWKLSFLRKNALLFTDNASWIPQWEKKWGVHEFPPSRRKLEWQAQDLASLWDCLMHLRPSGLRAKPPTYVPALVAITQTSIVGPRRRRLMPSEAARLQGFPDSFSFVGQPDASTYKQLGNGVNIGVVWNVLKRHCERDAAILETTGSGRRILAAVREAPDNPDSPVRDALRRAQQAAAQG